jgi:hypothetical protein
MVYEIPGYGGGIKRRVLHAGEVRCVSDDAGAGISQKGLEQADGGVIVAGKDRRGSVTA